MPLSGEEALPGRPLLSCSAAIAQYAKILLEVFSHRIATRDEGRSGLSTFSAEVGEEEGRGARRPLVIHNLVTCRGSEGPHMS